MILVAFIVISLAVHKSVDAVRVGTIYNASLLLTLSPNATMNGSTCDECLCAMLMNTANVSAVSFNCYAVGVNQVFCQLFTATNYYSTSFYQITADVNSTFYFLQLPTNNQSQPMTSEGTTNSASSTISTASPIVTITRAGDNITGVYNTTVGESTGGKDGRYASAGESPAQCIDNLTSTKYLNFGTFGNFNVIVPNAGAGSGFYVTPAASNASVAIGLRFATANDAPNRDPITVTLEGANVDALDMGSSWTLLYNGSTGISPSIDPGRQQYVPEQYFVNNIAYKSYRLLVTSQRAPEWCVQYAEVQILGYIK